MDGLFIVFILIGIVNAIFKWSKKQQATGGRQGQGAAPEKPWQRILGELSQTIEGSSSGEKWPAGKAFPTVIRKSIAPKVMPEGESSTEEWGATSNEYIEMTPNVVDNVYSTPPKQQYQGSLLGANSSLEGFSATTNEYIEMTPNVVDVIHSMSPRHQSHGSLSGTTSSIDLLATQSDEPAVTDSVLPVQPAFTLTFNRDALIQAVVMKEVLTHPRDRKRRWSGR